MIPRLIRFALILIAVQAIYCVPYLGLELLLGRGGVQVAATAAALALGLVLVVRRFAGSWIRLRDDLERRLSSVSPATLILVLALAGVAARAAWVHLFPAPIGSDGSVYYSLAKQLSEIGIYRDSRGESAFWPPGYPFFLVPFMRLFGAHEWVPFVANLGLYVASLPVVYTLARRAAGFAAPRVTTLLLAAWPNYVFSAGMASKELLLALLIPLALVLYLRSADAGGRGRAVVSGALSGAVFALASLAQPGVLLLPLALIGYEIVRRDPIGAAARRLAIVAVVLAICVGAWTYRNLTVLGKPVLISTNGGSTFYRANNPLATGGYTERGERSLDGLSELERNRRGLEYGLEWIRSHPGDFLTLAWRKQVLFLGDDGSGVYETLKRGLSIGDARYLLLKLAGNVYWLAIWLAILAGLLAGRGAYVPGAAVPVLLGLAVAYFWLIDSVFESGARHHMPLMGLFAVLATLGPPRGESSR